MFSESCSSSASLARPRKSTAPRLLFRCSLDDPTSTLSWVWSKSTRLVPWLLQSVVLALSVMRFAWLFETARIDPTSISSRRRSRGKLNSGYEVFGSFGISWPVQSIVPSHEPQHWLLFLYSESFSGIRMFPVHLWTSCEARLNFEINFMYCTLDRGVSTLLFCPFEDQHSIALKQVTAMSVSCTKCDGIDE